jgi:hypothetical protein
MTIQTLEQRSKLCVERIKSLRNAYIDCESEFCRNCCNGFDTSCPDYKPVAMTELSINKGRYYLCQN